MFDTCQNPLKKFTWYSHDIQGCRRESVVARAAPGAGRTVRVDRSVLRGSDESAKAGEPMFRISNHYVSKIVAVLLFIELGVLFAAGYLGVG